MKKGGKKGTAVPPPPPAKKEVAKGSKGIKKPLSSGKGTSKAVAAAPPGKGSKGKAPAVA